MNHHAHVRAITWFTPSHHGMWQGTTDNISANWWQPSPDLDEPQSSLAIIGRPVRYFQRMPAEARYSLCAVSLALKATNWIHEGDGRNPPVEVGMVAGRFDGCMAADLAYYQDYLASGRTLARGNMFVYTLPTSVLGAVSVVFGFQGPAFYVHELNQPLAGMVSCASQLIASAQADVMLAFWSDDTAAVCFAIDAGSEADSALPTRQIPLHETITPQALADQLQSQVNSR